MLLLSTIFTAALASAGLVSASPLSARADASAPINTLVFFGDSYSDNGNDFRVLGIPRQPYFQGRFSNGLPWSDLLAQQLVNSTVGSSTTNPNSTTYYNYAYGGAVASKKNLPASIPNRDAPFPPDMSQQLALFLANHSSAIPDPATTLYPIFIGGNDYVYTLAATIPSPQTIASSVVEAIRNLTTSPLKATRFLVLNLPDLGGGPTADKLRQRANDSTLPVAQLAKTITSAHNTILLTGLRALVAENTNLQINTLDLFGLYGNVTANPATYNLTNATAQCINLTPQARAANITNISLLRTADDVTVCDKPDEYVFWDNLHPTRAMHRIIAAAARRALTEPVLTAAAAPSVGGGNGTNGTSAGNGNGTEAGAKNGAGAVVGGRVLGLVGAFVVAVMTAAI
ncbi:GDSL-like Lipase/Acylhydrolase-domain-containing protein [Fimicolochytrium jonesii]|uniref:GDSL-like Lipase/Acylhydrolase-domain-containing protein n=1 Tax=Fimicolochytrium jonesii TaxID=1396493 RepID=UPI0022FEC394|nr:GDSL-like Lipase/Acylhydrolase-domain-containing protein [Fimicolochytrium jonesii]KAI8819206.1 GDSL-like Lipase/Acylhydrolase-domain-containing protein [Fimicolochytrium jonesii]